MNRRSEHVAMTYPSILGVIVAAFGLTFDPEEMHIYFGILLSSIAILLWAVTVYLHRILYGTGKKGSSHE